MILRTRSLSRAPRPRYRPSHHSVRAKRAAHANAGAPQAGSGAGRIGGAAAARDREARAPGRGEQGQAMRGRQNGEWSSALEPRKKRARRAGGDRWPLACRPPARRAPSLCRCPSPCLKLPGWLVTPGGLAPEQRSQRRSGLLDDRAAVADVDAVQELADVLVLDQALLRGGGARRGGGVSACMCVGASTKTRHSSSTVDTNPTWRRQRRAVVGDAQRNGRHERMARFSFEYSRGMVRVQKDNSSGG